MTFPETGKTVTGVFLKYWQAHGGLMQQGYPISDVIGEASDLDGNLYSMQYFERAVFEYHPEKSPPYDVLLSQLGTFRYKEKYPNGTPNQRVNQDYPRFFPETGHTVGGSFHEYWEANGGLAQQGYPISDEFQEESNLNGKTYTVQYFERAVFEYHPENSKPYDVLLSQLGAFQYKARYGIQPPSIPDPPASHYRSNLQGSDQYLVWNEASFHANDSYDIMGLDLKTNKTFVVSDAPNNQYDPQISGSLVVWADNSHSCSTCDLDVVGKDLATGTTYQIATGPTDQGRAAVAGRTVVWIEDEKIMAKDLDTNAVMQIASASAPPPALQPPAASDEYVVWSQRGQADYSTYSVPVQLFAYERKTGKTTVVAQYTSPINETYQYALRDHRVVWRDHNGLHMTNLSTGKSSLLYEGVAWSPIIRGDVVIWSVSVGNGFGIAGINLKESQEGDGKVVSPVSLTDGSSTGQPTIAGDWLVWLSSGGLHDGRINFKLLREAFSDRPFAPHLVITP